MEIFKKKKLFCFLFLFFVFIPFINVKAEELIYEYNYGNDIRTFKYDTVTKTLALKSTQHEFIYETVEHDYFIIFWYSSQFRLLQSDSPIYFDMSNVFYNVISDSTVYQTKFTWDGAFGSYIKTDKNTHIDDIPQQNYVGWGQIKSNYDVLLYDEDTYMGIYNLQNINDLQQNEYLFYEYEKIKSESNSYYNFIFSSKNFNSNYTYRIKFDNNDWINITSALESGYYSYQLSYNATLYMEVLNENNESIETKTFTVSDLLVYNQLISTSNYKGLIFSFDTSDFTENDTLNFNFNFYASDEFRNMIDSEFEVPYFAYNGKDVYSDGSFIYNYLTNKISYNPSNQYINSNFYQSLKYFVSDLKLFVNFDMLESDYLNVYLSSEVPFTVEYISKDIENVSYSEIDITGKYGVIFIPNDITNDYVTLMKFSENGKYSVQIRDNYSETNEDYNIENYWQIGFCENLDVIGLVPVHCLDTYFLTLSNNFRDKKQFVYVKNENNYDTSVKSVITYDTRYYRAYIQEYSNSNIEISNPNTGETDIFGPMTDFDNIYYEISNDNILELMKTFLEDLQQTSDTFNYMWDNFYSIMPDILKAFLQVITHLLCIWVFMKIVGYD